jgi:MoxR-like ATPase
MSELIPEQDPLFVPFGAFFDCEKILKSGIFYPTMLSGLSGVGKTVFIRELCAKYKREFYRVNITYQTDENDLIGVTSLKQIMKYVIKLNDDKHDSFLANHNIQKSTNIVLNETTFTEFKKIATDADYTLVNVLADTETVFEKGPVIKAMENGGILLLDELDNANPLLVSCLMSITEGSGYLIKKTGEFITPNPAFQIFATANTKGLGDSTGSFVGTQVLNEAFLERFPVTLECEYPPENIEKKILEKLMDSFDINNDVLVLSLLKFANNVRESYTNGTIEHTISTRRLVHIIRAYNIWQDVITSVKMAMNRFDTHTRNAFMDIFQLAFDDIQAKFDGDEASLGVNKTIDERLQPWQPW